MEHGAVEMEHPKLSKSYLARSYETKVKILKQSKIFLALFQRIELHFRR